MIIYDLGAPNSAVISVISMPLNLTPFLPSQSPPKSQKAINSSRIKVSQFCWHWVRFPIAFAIFDVINVKVTLFFSCFFTVFSKFLVQLTNPILPDFTQTTFTDADCYHLTIYVATSWYISDWVIYPNLNGHYIVHSWECLIFITS